MAMALKYVKPFTARLLDANGKRVMTLLWGDPVHVLGTGDPVRVRARRREGFLPRTDLADAGLLELYVIDVGQGDGVLVRTPDDRWHLIDAGIANEDQMTKKGAANFIRWKFIEDLQAPAVSLATVLVTHSDYDHYGGLIDLLSGKLRDGRTFGIAVEDFYHSGVGRFASSPKLGRDEPGRVAPLPIPGVGPGRDGKFITELLSGKTSFRTPARPFEQTFGEYARLVAKVAKRVRRLSFRDRFLPGYAPGETQVTISVLGPILEQLETGPLGLRVLGSESVTRNGHSIVLRLDYGNARILLTGDLNSKSQELLLSYQPETEFTVDVAKACHHGSEDVDVSFLRAIAARATVISSGDNEDYSHPRPVVMGASARYGREARGRAGDVLPPLVYSTELARSVKLAFADSVSVVVQAPPPAQVVPKNASVRLGKAKPPDRFLDRTPVAADLVYGLVNVRTDGNHVLCATLEEKGTEFDVKVFRAGVNV
jgi:beta-lactamase superfamily II metal-dependent hydrolase